MGNQDYYMLTVIVRGNPENPIMAACPIEYLEQVLWIYAVTMKNADRTVIWKVTPPFETKPEHCDARAKIQRLCGTVYVLLLHEQLSIPSRFLDRKDSLIADKVGLMAADIFKKPRDMSHRFFMENGGFEQ